MGNLAGLKQGLCLFTLFSKLVYGLLHPEEDKANVKLKGGGVTGAQKQIFGHLVHITGLLKLIPINC